MAIFDYEYRFAEHEHEIYGCQNEAIGGSALATQYRRTRITNTKPTAASTTFPNQTE